MKSKKGEKKEKILCGKNEKIKTWINYVKNSFIIHTERKSSLIWIDMWVKNWLHSIQKKTQIGKWSRNEIMNLIESKSIQSKWILYHKNIAYNDVSWINIRTRLT